MFRIPAGATSPSTEQAFTTILNKEYGAAATSAALPAIHMHTQHMHTQSPELAPCGRPTHPTSSHPLRDTHDATSAPEPTGLSQAELRRIVLDLIG